MPKFNTNKMWFEWEDYCHKSISFRFSERKPSNSGFITIMLRFLDHDYNVSHVHHALGFKIDRFSYLTIGYSKFEPQIILPHLRIDIEVLCSDFIEHTDQRYKAHRVIKYFMDNPKLLDVQFATSRYIRNHTPYYY